MNKGSTRNILEETRSLPNNLNINFLLSLDIYPIIYLGRFLIPYFPKGKVQLNESQMDEERGKNVV